MAVCFSFRPLARLPRTVRVTMAMGDLEQRAVSKGVYSAVVDKLARATQNLGFLCRGPEAQAFWSIL